MNQSLVETEATADPGTNPMNQDTTQDGVPDYNDREEYSGADKFGAPEPVRDTNEPPADAPIKTRRSIHLEVTASSHSCVMLGPARSGKTTLLTAIKRAGDQPADDDLNLEFIPGEETAKRIKIAMHNIVERKRGHEATQNVGSYPFEVHVSAKAPNFWSPPLEEDLHVMMSDGGGGFLLPSDEPYAKDHTAPVFRGGLIQTALSAKSMILCVDVTHPGSTILEKKLAISFAEDPRQRNKKAIRFTQNPRSANDGETAGWSRS